MKMVGNDWENRLKGPNSSKSLPHCPKMSQNVPSCPKSPKMSQNVPTCPLQTHRCPNGLVYSWYANELWKASFNIWRLFLFRSANLSQFIMHRGLLVSTMQAIFSSIFYFSAVPLFQVGGILLDMYLLGRWLFHHLIHAIVHWIVQSFLMVGYATIYTQLPVFSLVLDKDVTPKIAMDFPELYKELTKGTENYSSFC